MPKITPAPKTYIVLGDDGRHVTLTRLAMPHLDDQREAGRRLEAQGQGGWIVGMAGDYWAKVGNLKLTPGPMIAPTAINFFDAARAFLALRRTALGLPPAEPEAAAA